MTFDFREMIEVPSRVSAAIRSHAQAQALFDELCVFYGRAVHIQISPDARSSYDCPVNLDVSGAKIEWPSAVPPTISVAPSHRELEAACHEMLHLRLPKLGYAKFCSRTVASLPIEAADQIRHAINQIEHQVMFPQFLELGFDKQTFLVSGGTPKLDGQFEKFGDRELIADPRAWSREIVSFFSYWEHGLNVRWGEFHSEEWAVRP